MVDNEAQETSPPLPEGVPGTDIRALPRYPGSVRVEYERGKRNGLIRVRAEYLSRDDLDTVHGFYRGVFRSGGWLVGNVEYSKDRWTFLVIDGGREATINLEPQPPNTRIKIQVSKPQPHKQDKKSAQETPPEPAPALELAPAPAPAPAPSPTPTPVPAPDPAPVPGDDDDVYEYDEDDGGLDD